MQITPRELLLHYAHLLQGTLLGVLEAATGPLSEKARLDWRTRDDSTQPAIAVCPGLAGAASERSPGAGLSVYSQVGVRFGNYPAVVAASAYGPAAALLVRLDERAADSP